MGWFNHQPILISADKTMFFAIFGFSKVKLLNPRREMAVITHILGLKTFMFHGFGVQGNLVPNMAAIEKNTSSRSKNTSSNSWTFHFGCLKK